MKGSNLQSTCAKGMCLTNLTNPQYSLKNIYKIKVARGWIRTQRSRGYEPCEIDHFSTPHHVNNTKSRDTKI